jgi:hypothetical protein
MQSEITYAGTTFRSTMNPTGAGAASVQASASERIFSDLVGMITDRLFPIALLTLVVAASSCIQLAEESQASDAAKSGTSYQLYFLGGQSNMEGFGLLEDLSPEFHESEDQVMIFNGDHQPDHVPVSGWGAWMPLGPGFGTGYKATPDTVMLSDRFGPELMFGHRMQELTGKPVALIKYARGGSSIAQGASGFGSWQPEFHEGDSINSWDHFNQTVRLAFEQKDIDGDGLDDELIPMGIAWMQGESDAMQDWSAQAYYSNLNDLMQKVSSALGQEKLPVVLGKITESGFDRPGGGMEYIEIVHAAQEKYADHPQNALVSLDSITWLWDGWHYSSGDYLELGEKMAEAMYELNQQN